MSAPHINKVPLGGRPTLLEAEKANEVINALNVVGNITIEQQGKLAGVQYDDSGVKITIPEPDIPPYKPTTITTFPPIRVHKEGNNYTLYLEGYTKFVKYCGGAGHILFLHEGYDSTPIENALNVL